MHQPRDIQNEFRLPLKLCSYFQIILPGLSAPAPPPPLSGPPSYRYSIFWWYLHDTLPFPDISEEFFSSIFLIELPQQERGKKFAPEGAIFCSFLCSMRMTFTFDSSHFHSPELIFDSFFHWNTIYLMLKMFHLITYLAAETLHIFLNGSSRHQITHHCYEPFHQNFITSNTCIKLWVPLVLYSSTQL